MTDNLRAELERCLALGGGNEISGNVMDALLATVVLKPPVEDAQVRITRERRAARWAPDVSELIERQLLDVLPPEWVSKAQRQKLSVEMALLIVESFWHLTDSRVAREELKATAGELKRWLNHSGRSRGMDLERAIGDMGVYRKFDPDAPVPPPARVGLRPVPHNLPLPMDDVTDLQAVVIDASTRKTPPAGSY